MLLTLPSGISCDVRIHQCLTLLTLCACAEISLLEAFTAEVQTGLAPLLNNAYDDVEQLDREIEFVAGMLVDAAEHLPFVHPKKPTRWRDDILSSLCAQSRVARSA